MAQFSIKLQGNSKLWLSFFFFLIYCSISMSCFLRWRLWVSWFFGLCRSSTKCIYYYCMTKCPSCNKQTYDGRLPVLTMDFILVLCLECLLSNFSQLGLCWSLSFGRNFVQMWKYSIELPLKYSGYSVMDFRSLFGQRRGCVFREKFVKFSSTPPSPPKQTCIFFWGHIWLDLQTKNF
jgi:hypothetical protein